MNAMLRKFCVLGSCGLAQYLALQIFFVYSQAQQVLAAPEHQSEKFLNAFMAEPFHGLNSICRTMSCVSR
jgi:hypothetical protein